MQEQRFYFLVNRILSREATEAEKAELERLCGENESLRILHSQLFPPEQEEDGQDALLAYTAHYTRMQIAGHFEDAPAEQERSRFPRRMWMAAAAVILLLSAGGWWLWGGKEQPVVNMASREVKTQKGSQTYLTLPDGTEVWLNANSKIVYGSDFNETSRKVTLTGEAYFKVAPGEQKPFIIQAGGVKVKVLGTVFNVRSYPDEPNIETTLVSGSVAITLDDQPGNTIQLKPGEKLSVHNRTNTEYITSRRITDSIDVPASPILLLSKMRIDPTDSTMIDAAWKEGKLVFDGEEFGKVASKIEKWYNVTVIVENENLYTTTFTGVFARKPLATVLSSLQATGKLSWRQHNDTVYVH